MLQKNQSQNRCLSFLLLSSRNVQFCEMKNQISTDDTISHQPSLESIEGHTWTAELRSVEVELQGPLVVENAPEIAQVENTGLIEPHNLSAFINELEQAVDGYMCEHIVAPKV